MRTFRPERKSRGREIALWLVAVCLTASLSFAITSGAVGERLGAVRANFAAAATSPPPSFLHRTASALYRLICPLFSVCGDASVSVENSQSPPSAPPERSVTLERAPAATTARVPQTMQSAEPPAAAPSRPVVYQTVEQHPVVERVVERERVVTEGGVSETTLADRLQQLENKLRSLIFSQSSEQSAQTSAVSHAVALSQRIDNLSNTTITNPTITGGSITGTSIAGTAIMTMFTGLVQAKTLEEMVASFEAGNRKVEVFYKPLCAKQYDAGDDATVAMKLACEASYDMVIARNTALAKELQAKIAALKIQDKERQRRFLGLIPVDEYNRRNDEGFRAAGSIDLFFGIYPAVNK